jgi:hypothetical protein
MIRKVSVWPDDPATDHGNSAPVSPPHRQPTSRVLVLHQHRDPSSRFLDSVAERCRAQGVTPVVLSVAWSEKEARLRQRFAEEAFARLGQPAEFDLAAGCAVRTAVACAARLRGCRHVFVEALEALPWWRRLWGDARRRLLGRSGSLIVLTIPEAPVGAENKRSADPGRRGCDV